MRNFIYSLVYGAIFFGMVSFPDSNLALMASILLWIFAIFKFGIALNVEKIMDEIAEERRTKYENKLIYIRDSLLMWAFTIMLATEFPVLASVWLIGDFFIFAAFQDKVWNKKEDRAQ